MSMNETPEEAFAAIMQQPLPSESILTDEQIIQQAVDMIKRTTIWQARYEDLDWNVVAGVYHIERHLAGDNWQ